MKPTVVSLAAVALSGLLFCGSAGAVQTFSFDLVFSSGALAAFPGSMATITTTDGDTPGAFATWKNINNATVLDFSAMIVVDGVGTTLNYGLGNVAT